MSTRRRWAAFGEDTSGGEATPLCVSQETLAVFSVVGEGGGSGVALLEGTLPFAMEAGVSGDTTRRLNWGDFFNCFMSGFGGGAGLDMRPGFLGGGGGLGLFCFGGCSGTTGREVASEVERGLVVGLESSSEVERGLVVGLESSRMFSTLLDAGSGWWTDDGWVLLG
jgi:hypothetical protein